MDSNLDETDLANLGLLGPCHGCSWGVDQGAKFTKYWGVGSGGPKLVVMNLGCVRALNLTEIPKVRVFGEGVKSGRGETAILRCNDHTRNMFGKSLHTFANKRLHSKRQKECNNSSTIASDCIA